VFIGLDKASCMLANPILETVFIYDDLKLVEIDWDRVLPDDYTRVILHVLNLLEPGVASDVPGCEPFRRVCV